MRTKKTTRNITIRRTGTEPSADGPASMPKLSAAAAAVWDALTSHPGATAATLVTVSEVSRATVGKTLAALEADGRAIRTKGERTGKLQAPDTWHAATTDAHQRPDQPGPADAGPVPSEPAPAEPESIDPGRTEAAAPDPPALSDPAEDLAAAARATAIEQASTVIATITGDTESLNAALAAADLDTALARLDAIRASARNAQQIIKAGTKGRAVRTGNALRPGQLRDMVRDHLTAHPGIVLTPYQVGRAIGGRSSGAVANALDKLVEEGQATLVSDHPRQYQHAEPSRM
jgi:hypothetical protein